MPCYFLSIISWWLENVEGLEECHFSLLFCLFLNHRVDNSAMPNIKVRLLPLAWVPEFGRGQGVESTLCKENLHAVILWLPGTYYFSQTKSDLL